MGLIIDFVSSLSSRVDVMLVFLLLLRLCLLHLSPPPWVFWVNQSHKPTCDSLSFGGFWTPQEFRFTPARQREVMISRQGVSSVTTSERIFSVFIRQITFSNQAYWKSPRRVWDCEILSNVFFLGEFFLFLTQNEDWQIPQKDFLFWSCPISPKDPLGFFSIVMMKTMCRHVLPPFRPLETNR
jgi:hypothetical protein